MRIFAPSLRITLLGFLASIGLLTVAHGSDFVEPRSRAAGKFGDGILLLHANSEMSTTADGYRQDPFFYYFTGLDNTVGAILAIDGKAHESWLFLPSHPPFQKDGLDPEVVPGPGAEQRLDMAQGEQPLARKTEQSNAKAA